ncbi:MAG: lysozyme inhibitor LprI family protein [Alphaproteobacteria bacterium]
MFRKIFCNGILFIIFNFVFCNILLAAEIEFKPSFDCNKAITDIEKTICSNSTISILDNSLNFFYHSAVKVKPSLKEEQRIWLENRLNNIKELKNSYHNRIIEILLDKSVIDNVLKDFFKANIKQKLANNKITRLSVSLQNSVDLKYIMNAITNLYLPDIITDPKDFSDTIFSSKGNMEIEHIKQYDDLIFNASPNKYLITHCLNFGLNDDSSRHTIWLIDFKHENVLIRSLDLPEYDIHKNTIFSSIDSPGPIGFDNKKQAFSQLTHVHPQYSVSRYFNFIEEMNGKSKLILLEQRGHPARHDHNYDPEKYYPDWIKEYPMENKIIN